VVAQERTDGAHASATGVLAGVATVPAVARVQPTSTRRRTLPRPIRRFTGPIVLLAIWQLLSSSGLLPEDTLAGPATIATTAFNLTQSGELPIAMFVSLGRALAGILFGGLAGVGLAVLAGLFRVGEDMVDAPMQMLRAVPVFGLIPLLIIWFGIGESTKIIMVALAVAFPLYLNIYAGIRNVDNTLVEAAQTLGLSRAQQVWHVVLPATLPNAMVGLRQSLSVSWLALVFAETVNADAGLGFLLNSGREFYLTDQIVVCLIVYALLGLAVDFLVRLLERVLLAWRPAFNAS
jgi:sulfonate transport system permease protein